MLRLHKISEKIYNRSPDGKHPKQYCSCYPYSVRVDKILFIQSIYIFSNFIVISFKSILTTWSERRLLMFNISFEQQFVLTSYTSDVLKKYLILTGKQNYHNSSSIAFSILYLIDYQVEQHTHQ